MITTSYVTPKQILVADELAFTISVIVDNTGLVADADGKKILKAGSPVSNVLGSDVLQDRQKVLILDDTIAALGVTMHDVDVTAGATNAVMVVSGVVDVNKCGYVPAAAVQTALKRIIFVKGE